MHQNSTLATDPATHYRTPHIARACDRAFSETHRAPPGSVKSRLGLGPRGQDSDKTSPRTARNMATGEPTAKRLSMSNSNCGHRHPALPLSCSPTTCRPQDVRSWCWLRVCCERTSKRTKQNKRCITLNKGIGGQDARRRPFRRRALSSGPT
eukprot:3285926-Rhodomonas_salina.3